MFQSASIFESHTKSVRLDGLQKCFVPISYQELFENSLKYFKIINNKKYLKFSTLLHTHFHNVFTEDLVEMHEMYKYLDPDNEMITMKYYSANKYLLLRDQMFDRIDTYLTRANYIELDKDKLYDILNSESSHVEVNVDFDDFEEIKLYYRGESIESELKRDIKTLFLKKTTVEKKVFSRLFIILQPKTIKKRATELSEDGSITFAKARKRLKRSNPLLTSVTNTNVYIKAFKNIPISDLKMLFPNGKIRIKPIDKIKIGVLGGGGVIAGTSTFFIQITHIIDPVGALIALGTYSALLWRQVKEVIFQRTFYMSELAKKLYIHALGSNKSTLSYMIKSASESESKEALLSYLFILSNPSLAKTEKAIDKAIEKFIKDVYKIEIDFEIKDGVDKLKRLGLVHEQNGVLQVIDIDGAISKMNAQTIKIKG